VPGVWAGRDIARNDIAGRDVHLILADVHLHRPGPQQLADAGKGFDAP
jgi:hypothetical protein